MARLLLPVAVYRAPARRGATRSCTVLHRPPTPARAPLLGARAGWAAHTLALVAGWGVGAMSSSRGLQAAAAAVAAVSAAAVYAVPLACPGRGGGIAARVLAMAAGWSRHIHLPAALAPVVVRVVGVVVAAASM